MKNINKLMQEIIQITATIETDYPELYRYLDETPLFLSSAPDKDIDTVALENYLNTLKKQLHEHVELHKKK